jgi:transcriptional regulator NrdR family protein
MSQPQPQTVAKPEEQRGILCPRCGCGHFYVVYTRRAWGGRIVRRRECRHCGKRVTTFERLWA